MPRGGRTSRTHRLADDRGRPVASGLTQGNVRSQPVAGISMTAPLWSTSDGSVRERIMRLSPRSHDAVSVRLVVGSTRTRSHTWRSMRPAGAIGRERRPREVERRNAFGLAAGKRMADLATSLAVSWIERKPAGAIRMVAPITQGRHGKSQKLRAPLRGVTGRRCFLPNQLHRRGKVTPC